MTRALSLSAAVLLAALLACRPVFAIGWEEIVAVGLVIAFLLGPVLLRIARGWARLQDEMKKEKDRRP